MSNSFSQLAVALTFSPRFEAVIREADRIARTFDAPLAIVHADLETEEKAERFREALVRLERSHEKTPVLWAEQQEAPPLDAILTACQRAAVELLIAGALERDAEHRNFLGGVARGLLQKAPCDLLLLTKPSEEARPVGHVIIEVDLQRQNPAALQKSLNIARQFRATRVTFITIVTPFEEAISSTTGMGKRAEEIIEALVDPLEGFDGEVDVHVVRSTTGFGACDYIEETRADLLIVVTCPENGTRRLPAHMDWLLQVIPTNLLLIAGENGHGG